MSSHRRYEKLVQIWTASIVRTGIKANRMIAEMSLLQSIEPLRSIATLSEFPPIGILRRRDEVRRWVSQFGSQLRRFVSCLMSAICFRG